MWSRRAVSTLAGRSILAGVPRPRSFWGRVTQTVAPPAPPLAVEPITVETAQADDNQVKARQSLYELSSAIRLAKSSNELTSMWSTLSSNSPVAVVDVGGGGEERTVVALTDSETPPPPSETTLAIRMVSALEMLHLAKQGNRHLVVERAPSYTKLPRTKKTTSSANKNSTSTSSSNPSITSSDTRVYTQISLPQDNILLVSEPFIARKIIFALSQLDGPQDHDKDHAITQFLETFEADRQVLRTVELLKANDDDTKQLVTQLTQLGKFSDAIYVSSLGRLHGHDHKILARCKAQENLGRYIFYRDAFRSVLDACVRERDGDFARKMVDFALDNCVSTTFNVRQFTAAIHANLRGEKTPERLANALHVNKRMRQEVGYIVAPQEWSLLLNSCIYLDQQQAAMEIFEAYRDHGIEPFQSRFRQAVRTACVNKRYELALQMVRCWIKTEQKAPVLPSTLPRDLVDAGEAECFNKILWEMLKGDPTLSQLEQVVKLMEKRQVRAGALVIRRLITQFLRTSTAKKYEYSGGILSPEEEKIDHLFFVWENCPNVIYRTGFVLYVVLEQCHANGWTNQYEKVLQYGLDHQLGLPWPNVVKLLDQYAAKGEFESAIQLGELVAYAPSSVASARSRNQKDRIPDTFFESLVTCYLLREQFEKVLKVDAVYHLSGQRTSPKLAALLRDAREQLE